MRVKKEISIITSAFMAISTLGVFRNGSPIGNEITAVAENSLQFYDAETIYDYPLYLAKVRDLQENGTYKECENGFFLCDINNDEMPELFVTNNINAENGGSIIFAGTIYEDEIVSFFYDSGAGGHRFATLCANGYIEITYTSPYIIESISKYNGDEKLTEVISFSYDGKKYQKQIDGISYEITQKEFQSFSNLYEEASYSAYPIPIQLVQDDIVYERHFDYYEACYYIGSNTTLTIPAEINGLPVTGIGKDLFNYYDPGVTTLNLPSSLEYYYYRGISGNSLTAINIDVNNPYYTSKDGVLYNKSITELERFPAQKDVSSYSFPESVSNINRFAFAWSSIKKIDLPNTITQISDYAFYCCPNLSSITIRNSECDIYDYVNDGVGLTICNSYDSANDSYNYLGVICGYDDSSAKAYADYFDRTFISLGQDPDKIVSTTTTSTTSTTTSTTTTTTQTTTTTTSTATEITTTNPVITTTTSPSDPVSYKLGDVNDDGFIDATDSSDILSEYARTSTGEPRSFTDKQFQAADVNCDEIIDSTDASSILSYYAYTSTGGKQTIEKYLSDSAEYSIEDYPLYQERISLISSVRSDEDCNLNSLSLAYAGTGDTAYSLTDLNDDGLPELLVTKGTFDDGNACIPEIYAISDESLVRVLITDIRFPGVFYEGNVISTNYTNMMGNGIVFLRYNSGSNMDVVDEIENRYESGVLHIYNNGQEISEDERAVVLSGYTRRALDLVAF